MKSKYVYYPCTIFGSSFSPQFYNILPSIFGKTSAISTRLERDVANSPYKADVRTFMEALRTDCTFGNMFNGYGEQEYRIPDLFGERYVFAYAFDRERAETWGTASTHAQGIEYVSGVIESIFLNIVDRIATPELFNTWAYLYHSYSAGEYGKITTEEEAEGTATDERQDTNERRSRFKTGISPASSGTSDLEETQGNTTGTNTSKSARTVSQGMAREYAGDPEAMIKANAGAGIRGLFNNALNALLIPIEDLFPDEVGNPENIALNAK